MITGKIQKTEESKDGNRNIVIYVNFYEDGKLIVENWPLYARFENFLGMDKEQMSKWISVNIELQIGNLIKAKNQAAINATLMGVIESLTDREYQVDKVNITMSGNGFAAVVMPEFAITTPYTVTLSQDGTVSTVEA